MEIIKGIAVSPGIVIGRIFALDSERQRIPRRSIAPDAVQGELARLDGALDASIRELDDVRAGAEVQMGPDAAKIFSFHQGMLADKTLIGPMRAMIQNERVTAEYAVYRTFADWALRFRGWRSNYRGDGVSGPCDVLFRYRPWRSM